MKRLLWVAYAVYLVVFAYLVWDPDPTVAPSAVYHVTDILNSIGIGVGPSMVEFGLNVLLFTPMSLIGSFIFPRLRVADWVLIGFVASFVVELVQKYFLPVRSADERDIVANTLGALIGAVLAWLLKWAQDRWLRSERSERLEAKGLVSRRPRPSASSTRDVSSTRDARPTGDASSTSEAPETA